MRRYLLCCEHYVPSVGGVQEVMRQVAERLVLMGSEVTVLTSAHPARPRESWIAGVRVVSFDIAGNDIKGLRGDVASFRSFLRQAKVDALLIKAAQQWTFDAALDVLPSLPYRKVFIPCGFSGLHDVAYAEYYRKMPAWLRLFDELVFYSPSYQDVEYARKHAINNFRIIPNGVDEREFASAAVGDIRQRLSIPSDDDLLLSVGSLISAKGHWETVRAFIMADLPRPATLVINGNAPGGTLTRLRRFAKHLTQGRAPLGLEAWLRLKFSRRRTPRRVRIINLPRSKLVSLYGAADLFVFASHIEYSPLVLFESAAAGTPFVAADAGNSREIAQWTAGGIIVRSSSERDVQGFVQALAKEIVRQLSDRPRLEVMGLLARGAVFEKRFTWDTIAREYASVLEGSTSTSFDWISTSPK